MSELNPGRAALCKGEKFKRRDVEFDSISSMRKQKEQDPKISIKSNVYSEIELQEGLSKRKLMNDSEVLIPQNMSSIDIYDYAFQSIVGVENLNQESESSIQANSMRKIPS